jgi:hypothetical protein
VIVDYVERDPSLVRLPLGSVLGQLSGFADPAAPAAAVPSKHQALDAPAFSSDGVGQGLGAGSKCCDRARQLFLRLGGQGQPSVPGEPL